MTIWTEFGRTLERAGELIDRPETPADEIDRAEGLRCLTRLLRVGLDLAVEFGDPWRPEVVSAQAKHFGDAGTTPTASTLGRHARRRRHLSRRWDVRAWLPGRACGLIA